LGFLSGVGYEAAKDGDNPLNEMDAEAVWARLDNYCQGHPLDPISDAVAAFVHAHRH
jgi:hypothetical protein